MSSFNLKITLVIHSSAVSNLEEKLTELAGKDGWIKVNEFMRFAYGTELCKVLYIDIIYTSNNNYNI